MAIISIEELKGYRVQRSCYWVERYKGHKVEALELPLEGLQKGDLL